MSPRKTFFWIVHVSEPPYRNNQKEVKFVHQFNEVSLIMTESDLLEKDTIESLNRSPFLIHVSQKVAHILWILLHSKTGSNQRFKRFLTSYQEIFKSLSFTAVDKFKTQHQQAQKQRKEKALPIPLIKKKKAPLPTFSRNIQDISIAAKERWSKADFLNQRICLLLTWMWVTLKLTAWTLRKICCSAWILH